MTGARSVTFCSRSCASAGSVTDARRDAWQKSKKNLENGRTPKEIARRLWSREYWKYAKVQALLDFLDESYEFEFPVGHHIFDLALFAHKVLVEFDGTYHNDVNQRKADAKKTAYAKKRGWIVVRVATPPSTVIEASTVHTVLKK
jgi:very-short-patch-repair endonuclease